MNTDLKKDNDEQDKVNKTKRLNKDGTVDLRYKNKGGARRLAGRPKGSKEKVILHAKMDKLINGNKVLNKLKKLIYDDKHPKHYEAIKLYLSYRFGRPIEHKEVKLFKEQPLFVLNANDITDIEEAEVINNIIGDDTAT